MSYKSKRILLSMCAGLALTVAYVVHALGKSAPAPEDLRGWAALMLIFAGIGIVGQIVLQLLFHFGYAIGIAVQEHDGDEKKVERIMDANMAEDEMDKLIGLKGAHAAFVLTGLGFVAALAALALGASVLAALHGLLGAFALANLLEGAVSIRLYERGVRNG